MPDVLTEKQRSYCMSQIRGRNTGPEMKLRRVLWRAGLRYRLASKLPGRPDIVFPRQKVAIFVDGCFWHACPKHRIMPKSNARFWADKIERTVRRDREVNTRLSDLGWTVLRFWEHDVNTDLEGIAFQIERVLSGIERASTCKN
ncbi:MAG: very short patch repair endonuclease, partial [Nitratireductor sp.]